MTPHFFVNKAWAKLPSLHTWKNLNLKKKKKMSATYRCLHSRSGSLSGYIIAIVHFYEKQIFKGTWIIDSKCSHGGTFHCLSLKQIVLYGYFILSHTKKLSRWVMWWIINSHEAVSCALCLLFRMNFWRIMCMCL